MSLGQVLKVTRDIINYLDANGMILANGSVDFANLQNDLKFISEVEQSLKSHGVTIPDQVDKILAILPLAIQLGGSFKS